MREYLSLLARDTRGIATLSNLVDAVDRGLIDSGHCVNFLTHAKTEFKKEVAGGRKVLPSLAYRNLRSAVRPIGAFGARLPFASEILTGTELSYVAPISDVAKYHFPSRYHWARLGHNFRSLPTQEKRDLAQQYIDAIKGVTGEALPATADEGI